VSDGEQETGGRRVVSVAFSAVQDVVYVALGVLLAVTAGIMLVQGAIDLARTATEGMDVRAVVSVLDRILLALMVVELLYTVQVSFREHALAPEPFLIVGLIAVTRRILVLTAEFESLLREGGPPFRDAMLELAVLAVLVLVLVVSVVLLRRRGVQPVAEKA
jgi:uncharacterized membrane protein (DUF373 family)